MTKQARKVATPKRAPATKPPSGWAKLSKGTKALVALIGTTAVAAVVPGVLPYASDRVLDLFRSPIVELRSSIGPSAHGAIEAATEVVTTTPEDPGADPRFVPAGYALTRITLEGKRSAAVTVLDTSVEIVDRQQPPRRGTLYFIPPQGEEDNTVVDLDLDAPRPVLTAHGGGPYFVGKHLTLGRGELWVVDVQSRATQHEYAWRLHLHLRYRGADREMTVPPAGSPPYRMTALVAPGDYRRLYTWNVAADLIGYDCVADRAACAATKLPVVKAP